jgi:signal transduction histidine kinase
MKIRSLVRMVAPTMAISLIPLVVGVVSAWKVHTSQEKTSHALALDVAGMRAGEELAIGIRDVWFNLDRFLITGERSYLEEVTRLRRDTDPWLAVAQRAALTAQEQGLIARVQTGYRRFFDEYDRIAQEPVAEVFRARLRELKSEALTNEILQPAQKYLDLTEEEIAATNENNLRMTDRMVLGLLLLGICGPVSGLVAGYGIARSVSRSIGRLSVPIRDAAGKLNEIVGPITLSARWDLEEVEAVLHKIADQIGAIIERLQQSQRETLRAEQLAAVGQMAAGIAHELRNPLMSMNVLVQLAAERGPSAILEARDLAVLQEEIGRLEHLTQMFLDFARPPQVEKRSFEMRGLLQQIVDFVSGRAERQGVRIVCALLDEPVLIQADIGQVRQVVLNLLLNALDAVPAGGTIWLEIGKKGSGVSSDRVGISEDSISEKTPDPFFSPDGWLVLCVADTGHGLPAYLGERIFEPFVTTKETGVGLGLSICKRIVEAHGGQIAAANRPGGGALFTVRLPLSRQVDQETRSQGNHAQPAGSR